MEGLLYLSSFVVLIVLNFSFVGYRLMFLIFFSYRRYLELFLDLVVLFNRIKIKEVGIEGIYK